MSKVIVASEVLESLSNATTETVEKVAPSVVTVSTGMGSGSGVVWSPDGYIVTCSHVVGRRSVIKVSIGSDSFEAKVVGLDPYSDVALLKIEGTKLRSIELGDSDNLKVGQFVLALANPFNRQPSATFGVITSVGSSLKGWRGITMENVIVTDARLNPGYSGGPLIDVSGKMIGLNTAYVWSRGVAVPVNTVKNTVAKLARDGSIKRAYLGIASSSIALPRELAAQEAMHQDGGVIVLSVEPDSPAKRAGLAMGDIVVKFNGRPVTSIYDWQKLLTEETIGSEIPLRILRAEKLIELAITPSARV